MRGDQTVGWIILAAVAIWLVLEGVAKVWTVLARIDAEQDWAERLADNGITDWDADDVAFLRENGVEA